MTNATTLLSIGTQDCNDGTTTRLISMYLGAAQNLAEEYGGPAVDIARAGVRNESGLVESRFVIEVIGASVDAVGDKVAAISGQLRALVPIAVGLRGSEHTGTIYPRITQASRIPLETPFETQLMDDHRTRIEVVVRHEPWYYTPEQAVIDGASTALPAVVDVSAMEGTAPGPLNLLLEGGAIEIESFYAGAYPDESAAITLFVREAVDLSWSGGAATTDAAGWPDGSGNTVWRTNSLTAVYADVDVSDFEPGEYHVFCRGKASNALGTVYAKQAYGDYVELEATSFRLYHLGVVTLPTSAVYGAASSTLRVYLKGDATYYAVANTLVFIPASFGGMVGWKADSGHAHDLVFEDDVVYRDAYGDVGNAFGERRVKALGGALVVIAEKATPTPTCTLDLTVYVDPRYEQLPS